MMHPAKPRCLGYEDNNNCSNIPRKNYERCRPCDSLFRARKAPANAQGTAVTAANQQQAFRRAQILAQAALPPSDQESNTIREIVDRCRNRRAIITLTDGSSFTVQKDRFIGDYRDQPMTTVLAAHLRTAQMPVGIILRVFTGRDSTVPFPNDPSKMLPLKAIASCLYHEGSLTPLEAELTRDAYKPQPDIEFEDW